MPSWLAWSLTGVALVVLLTVVVIASRLINLLRTPGSFKARLVSKAGDSGSNRPDAQSVRGVYQMASAVCTVRIRHRLSMPGQCLAVIQYPLRTRIRSALRFHDTRTCEKFDHSAAHAPLS